MNNDLYYIFDACLALPCLALPCLALPCLALPCLALPCLALPCLALPCLALPCLANNLNFLFNLSKNQYYIKSFSYDFLNSYLIMHLLNMKIFRQQFKFSLNFNLIINKKNL
ncbi:hypothetical protein EPJ79_06905 [Brachyspira aalborgi]|uniref:Uncharacterized protein n=1 Tax=Brachyspira aalborgi TaxID=29522 RepID=A0A5C8D6Y9_9SPIR|nr:hypothetical protein EPJ79_06905 [Brachyspira aalborgi]